MRDLAFIAFIAAILALGLKRPFIFALAYVYVDVVSPQRLSYYLLNSIPLSAIVAGLTVGAWLLVDARKGFSVGGRQWLMALLLAYVAATTYYADLHLYAMTKWEWAWKALGFAIFLPLMLRTKLRIEAFLLFMLLSAGTIIIVGGLKTAMAGGGYGALNLMVHNNSGLYEGSILSTFAIASIPLILWFARFGTIFPPDWRVKLFCGALIFACLLLPVGAEARTGLVCIGVLALLMLRDVKRRLLYIGAVAALGLVAIPFLPSTFTDRMQTIQGYQADQSASTRLAVWAWTLDYVQSNPFGGGFEAYRQNRINVTLVDNEARGDVQVVSASVEADEARAYHSAYFEMLGEQGWPGLFLFLLIHGIGLVRMEILRRRYAKRTDDMAWVAPLATAFQHFQIIYLVGSLFVATAFQPFIWMAIAAQIGFDQWVTRRERAERREGRSFVPARPAPEPVG